MPYEYSDESRASDTWALPDVEIFQLSAWEAAERDEDLIYEYMKRHEFRLAGLNTRIRHQMLDAIVEEEGISGGWFYWSCFPGCMPEGDASGPYPTYAAALAASREDR